MRLDKELVRDILLAIEASTQSPMKWIDLDFPARGSDEVAYHVMLLHEAGLLVAQDVTTLSRFDWRPLRLTYDGHEFLDTVRDSGVWRATKAAGEKVGGASIAFLWELAKLEVRARLGLPS